VRVTSAWPIAPSLGPVDAPASSGKGLRVAGLVGGGLGLAALGAGAFFGVQARSRSDELSKPGAVYDPAKVDDGEAAEQRMIIATAAGGALVIGGAVLYFLGRSKARAAEHASIAPVNGGALVVVGGGF